MKKSHPTKSSMKPLKPLKVHKVPEGKEPGRNFHQKKLK